jgi:hypothetical protein
VSPRTCLHPDALVHSQGAALVDLSTAIQNLFGDIQDVAQLVAPIAAVIGFIGLGIMYVGSSWPLIGDWKKDNPKAANQVVIGLLFIVFASSVTALITFA